MFTSVLRTKKTFCFTSQENVWLWFQNQWETKNLCSNNFRGTKCASWESPGVAWCYTNLLETQHCLCTVGYMYYSETWSVFTMHEMCQLFTAWPFKLLCNVCTSHTGGIWASRWGGKVCLCSGFLKMFTVKGTQCLSERLWKSERGRWGREIGGSQWSNEQS